MRRATVRRQVAVVAILAILAQALLSAWHWPMARQPAGAAALGARSVVICTALGFRTVRVDSNGRPIAPLERPDQQPSSGICPVCAALGVAASALVPSTVTVVQSAGWEAVAFSLASERSLSRRPVSRRGRDPPVVV
ncbi:MAG: hypothetical protein KDJ36_00430 [Hyphomicrobiaceae bacterium]|nr:hypothetical protein [Hyphomicrobiaceae bacterium]